MISWNFAFFLLLIASIVIATPFAGRQDWLGWTASVLVVAATLAILATYLSAIVRTVKEWWYDELD